MNIHRLALMVAATTALACVTACKSASEPTDAPASTSSPGSQPAAQPSPTATPNDPATTPSDDSGGRRAHRHGRGKNWRKRHQAEDPPAGDRPLVPSQN